MQSVDGALIQFEKAVSSDEDQLLELIAEYYEYDGHHFDEERIRPPLRTLLWNDEPVVEYRFTFFDDDETGEHKGGLMKWWQEAPGLFSGECFTFGYYEDVFSTEVEQVLAKARRHADEENLDYFLALTDTVKERALDAEIEDEEVFSVEGLLAAEPENAYSRL